MSACSYVCLHVCLSETVHLNFPSITFYYPGDKSAGLTSTPAHPCCPGSKRPPQYQAVYTEMWTEKNETDIIDFFFLYLKGFLSWAPVWLRCPVAEMQRPGFESAPWPFVSSPLSCLLFTAALNTKMKNASQVISASSSHHWPQNVFPTQQIINQEKTSSRETRNNAKFIAL